MFSRTESSSTSPSDCGRMARSIHGRRSAGVSPEPGHRTSPESACSHPHSRFKSVVLPEPDGPTSPTTSPSRSANDTPSSAWTSSGPRL